MARSRSTAINSSRPPPRETEQVAPPVRPARANTKSAAIIALLKRKRRATIQELIQVAHWQAHPIRGFLAGSLSKRHGLAVTSEKLDGKKRRYRVQ